MTTIEIIETFDPENDEMTDETVVLVDGRIRVL